MTGSRHPYEWLTTSNITYDQYASTILGYQEDHPGVFNFHDARVKEKAPPSIGNDVWIGQNVTLNRGISIGDGAVVAAYSVITKNVPPYAIVGGNPARIIKYRFPVSTVARLLELRWWRFEPAQFKGHDITDVESFLRNFSEESLSLEEYEPTRLTAESLSAELRSLSDEPKALS